MFSFNPRAREGRDRVCCKIAINDCVSIHAPVKGATVCLCSVCRVKEFQSTRP